jgi:hypothetical protein
MYDLKHMESDTEVSFDWNDVSPDVKANGEFHDLMHIGLRIWVPKDWVVREEYWKGQTFYNVAQGSSLYLSIDSSVDNRSLEQMPWGYRTKATDYYWLTINGIKAVCLLTGPNTYYTYIDSAAGRCTAAFYVSEEHDQQTAGFLDTVASSFQLIDSPLAGYLTKQGVHVSDITQFAVVGSETGVYDSPDPSSLPSNSVFPGNLLYIAEGPKSEAPGWCMVMGGNTQGYMRCKNLYRLAQDELVDQVVDMLQCGGDPWSALEAAGMTLEDLGLQ